MLFSASSYDQTETKKSIKPRSLYNHYLSLLATSLWSFLDKTIAQGASHAIQMTVCKCSQQQIGLIYRYQCPLFWRE